MTLRGVILAALAVLVLAALGSCEDTDAQRMRACGVMCGGRPASYRMEKRGWVYQPVCECGPVSDAGR